MWAARGPIRYKHVYDVQKGNIKEHYNKHENESRPDQITKQNECGEIQNLGSQVGGYNIPSEDREIQHLNVSYQCWIL